VQKRQNAQQFKLVELNGAKKVGGKLFWNKKERFKIVRSPEVASVCKGEKYLNDTYKAGLITSKLRIYKLESDHKKTTYCSVLKSFMSSFS
jgi:hypothetical protein